MTVACPNGHQSGTSDYCDQCGALIGGAVPAPVAADPDVPASAVTASPPSPAPAPAQPGSFPLAPVAGENDEPCPLCQTPRVGADRFCEGCGFDFTAPAPVPGTMAATPLPDFDPATTAAWEAIAVADRDYYDRVAPEGVTFPLHCPPRTYVLAGDEIRVGRRSNSRGIQPEVDLSGAPEDPAISHLHCLLIHAPDGSYSVVDPGSTNGTTLNDDPTPLSANSSATLKDGDRIHLGAWTTITIRARRAPDATTSAP